MFPKGHCPPEIPAQHHAVSPLWARQGGDCTPRLLTRVWPAGSRRPATAEASELGTDGRLSGRGVVPGDSLVLEISALLSPSFSFLDRGGAGGTLPGVKS